MKVWRVGRGRVLCFYKVVRGFKIWLLLLIVFFGKGDYVKGGDFFLIYRKGRLFRCVYRLDRFFEGTRVFGSGEFLFL